MTDATAPQERSSRLSVTFILITLVIDAMGIGLIVPVMPDLLKEVQGTGVAQAALWGGLLSFTFAIVQFVFAPILGGLSDRYGRRPVLLISMAVMAVDYLIMAFAGAYWLLLLGRVIGGATAATQSTAAAYMADISRPEDKAKNFGLVGAAFGIGFVLGPMIGGFLGEFGTRAPFYAAAILSALNFVFGYFVLRETVDDRIRRDFSLKRANPLGSLKVLGANPVVGRLLLVYFIYQCAFMIYPAIWSYFGNARFGWGPGTIGLSLGLFGIMMAIVQAGLIRLVLKWLGERGTVTYGHAFDVLAFLALALVTNGTIALILTPLAALAGVITPALQGIMSQNVGDDEQGELQGALTSASAVASIIGFAIYPWIFARFADETGVYNPGAPFLLSAILISVGLLVFLRARLT